MPPDTELRAWLGLSLTEELTPATFRKLLAAFGGPEEIRAASSEALSRLATNKVVSAIRRGPDSQKLENVLRWLDDPANTIVCLADPQYPRLLLEIADPPVILYVKGNASLLNQKAMAVVGSRNATPQGVANAAAFSRDLSDAGLTVVSGLALGIDAAAHEGSLDGASSSVAVIGTGLDIIYPARNRALAHKLATQGAMVSEFPLGTAPVAANFPRRNRVISGLSHGCLVVEANIGSGSLITARCALEQGREVFAIPGSIHSPLSKGCHLLIKQGAKLVESSADILDELGMSKSTTISTPDASAELPDNRPLLGAMGFDPIDLETLCSRGDLTPENASAALLDLELDGLVTRLPGGKFQRVRQR